jgi:hypothetical protein
MSLGMEATGAYEALSHYMGGSRFVKLFSRYTTKYILKIYNSATQKRKNFEYAWKNIRNNY